MRKFEELLKGGDLRSLGKAGIVAKAVNNQSDFDNLFKGLFNSDRKVVMRTSDAIEKITLTKPEYLKPHKKQVLELCRIARNIELKWHLALLISRLELTEIELGHIWQLLTDWAANKNESKIVRVNSIQGLYDLLKTNQELEQDFRLTINEVMKENIPSINARIRKLRIAST